MIKSLRWLTFFAAFALVVPLSGKDWDEIDTFIEQQRQNYRVPGLAIAIVENDQIVFLKGYGLAQIGKEQRVDENTIFQLASLSKTFASAGLGKLVDQKKLQWDDEIHRFLPQFNLKDLYATRFTTSRDLLAHRTGLPSFKGDLLNALDLTSQEALARLQYIDPESSFREKAFYSNVGYFVAGEVLSAVSQKTWEEEIRESFFLPLKMTRSGFVDNLKQSNVAYAHVLVDGKLQVIPWNTHKLFVAAGGVTSSVKDLAYWALLHLNEGKFEGSQILSPETIFEMHRPSMVVGNSFTDLPPLTSEASLSYGLGWNNYHYLGHVIVEKGGALEGVRALLTLVPEKKIGIVILANLNLTVLPELIRTKLLDVYFEKNTLDLEQFAQGQENLNQLVVKKEMVNPLPMNHPLESYQGVYFNDLYGEIKVVVEKDGLAILAGSTPLKGRLDFWSNDTFSLIWPYKNFAPQLSTFVFGPEGKTIEMQTESLGNFKRIKS